MTIHSCYRKTFGQTIDVPSILKIVAIVAMLVAAPVMAQSSNTEHTFKLDNPGSTPRATLRDMSWLVGAWSGPAMGGTAEEVWSPPSAGTMVGSFKLTKDGEILFYEFMLLVEEQGSLILKLKHFNADFTAWEDKADYIRFPFIRADDDAVHFSGLSFYQVSPDELHVYVALRDGQDVEEEKLIYIRRN